MKIRSLVVMLAVFAIWVCIIMHSDMGFVYS